MRLPLQGGHAVDVAVRAEEELDGWLECVMYGGLRQQCAWVCVCFWKDKFDNLIPTGITVF